MLMTVNLPCAERSESAMNGQAAGMSGPEWLCTVSGLPRHPQPPTKPRAAKWWRAQTTVDGRSRRRRYRRTLETMAARVRRAGIVARRPPSTLSCAPTRKGGEDGVTSTERVALIPIKARLDGAILELARQAYRPGAPTSEVIRAALISYTGVDASPVVTCAPINPYLGSRRKKAPVGTTPIVDPENGDAPQT